MCARASRRKTGQSSWYSTRAQECNRKRHDICGVSMMNRRRFVQRAGLAAAALPLRGLAEVKLPFEVTVHAPKTGRAPMGMPGIFPGRVVEVRDDRVIAEGRISEEVVHRMLERGMKDLTGAPTAVEAWRRFFEPRDVVAIKVNPSGTPGTTTQVELIREVI